VTDKRLVGKTLEDIVQSIDQIRGIFLRGILRNSKPIPVGLKTVVERGDIVQVSGPEVVVENFARIAGRVLAPVQESDLATL